MLGSYAHTRYTRVTYEAYKDLYHTYPPTVLRANRKQVNCSLPYGI